MARKNGYQTKNRGIIKEYLQQNRNRTITALDIHAHMKETGNEINRTTVYRYLEKLESEGKIQKHVSKLDKKTAYSYREESDDKKHLYIKCVRCNRIFRIKDDFAERIAQSVWEDYNCRVLFDDSSINALCGDCEARFPDIRK